MKHADVIIIGAGAAGLMCAIKAGQRGRSVIVLERNAKVAQKIRISGGGRCNFTNLDVRPKHFLSQNPHFCVSALKRFTPMDFIALVESHSIAYFEKTRGQLFCKDSAQQIIDLLLEECRKSNVIIQTETEVRRISRKDNAFELETDKGALSGTSLVIATGGPSIPKMGASGFGYDIARQFGLTVVAPRAGLVPLAFGQHLRDRLKDLTGTAAEAEVCFGDRRFRDALLFTHRGISGPAILQISSYWREGKALVIDFAPGIDLFDFLVEARTQKPTRAAHTILAEIIPKRLARFLCLEAGIDGAVADLSNEKLHGVVETVKAWRVNPVGTEGYRTAEVTCGGVDTGELSSKTFETNAIPGLYFIGEVVDVTGHLGGYNFHWAWASGYAAGQFV